MRNYFTKNIFSQKDKDEIRCLAYWPTFISYMFALDRNVERNHHQNTKSFSIFPPFTHILCLHHLSMVTIDKYYPILSFMYVSI